MHRSGMNCRRFLETSGQAAAGGGDRRVRRRRGRDHAAAGPGSDQDHLDQPGSVPARHGPPSLPARRAGPPVLRCRGGAARRAGRGRSRARRAARRRHRQARRRDGHALHPAVARQSAESDREPRRHALLQHRARGHPRRASTPTTWWHASSASRAPRSSMAATSSGASTISAGCPRCPARLEGRVTTWLRSTISSDDSVVVVIGSGAGGATLANELAQKGVDVVCLEAGPRLTLADIVNDFGVMFGRLSWLDKRIGSGDLDPTLPLWVCKTVGGTTVHWAGASLRFQDHEWKARTTYGGLPGTSLLDWPIDGGEMARYYDRAEEKIGVAGHRRPAAPARQQQLQGAGLRRPGAGLQEDPHRQHGDQLGRARRAARLPAARLLHGRLRDRRQVVDALHRGAQGRGDRPLRAAAGSHGLADPARRRGQGDRRALRRSGTAITSCRRRGRCASPATRSRRRGCCSIRRQGSSRTASPTRRARSAGTSCAT